MSVGSPYTLRRFAKSAKWLVIACSNFRSLQIHIYPTIFREITEIAPFLALFARLYHAGQYHLSRCAMSVLIAFPLPTDHCKQPANKNPGRFPHETGPLTRQTARFCKRPASNHQTTRPGPADNKIAAPRTPQRDGLAPLGAGAPLLAMAIIARGFTSRFLCGYWLGDGHGNTGSSSIVLAVRDCNSNRYRRIGSVIVGPIDSTSCSRPLSSAMPRIAVRSVAARCGSGIDIAISGYCRRIPAYAHAQRGVGDGHGNTGSSSIVLAVRDCNSNRYRRIGSVIVGPIDSTSCSRPLSSAKPRIAVRSVAARCGSGIDIAISGYCRRIPAYAHAQSRQCHRHRMGIGRS